MRSRGWIKGEPLRFVQGHWSRTRKLKTYGYTVEDRGFATPCHIHSGPRVSGYGWERRDYTHRLAFRDRGIEIPPGIEVDHLCNVPACKRFDHLELVTRQEHAQRTWDRAPERKLAGTAAGAPWKTPHMTTCRAGHPLSGDNLYVKQRKGCRPAHVCRQCAREKARERRLST